MKKQQAKLQAARERERFFQKINHDGPIPAHCPELGPCAIWKAAANGYAKNGYGYGTFSLAGRSARAHRVAFYFEHGRWPKHDCLHKCDNPGCVRPSHLFEGTAADNSADMVAKGRWDLTGKRSTVSRSGNGKRFRERCQIVLDARHLELADALAARLTASRSHAIRYAIAMAAETLGIAPEGTIAVKGTPPAA